MRVADRLPILSLFCGAGGLDVGFTEAGFSTLLAVDHHAAAVNTYNWNRPDGLRTARIADLSTTTAADLSAWWQERAGPKTPPVGVIGGPPCQAFSVGNVHKRDDDPRAKLSFNYAALLKGLNDKYALKFFLFENSAGLTAPRHSAALQALEAAFDDAGFVTIRFELDAADFGVAQHRRRVFIVGINKALRRSSVFEPPIGGAERGSVRSVIGELPEPMRFARGHSPSEFGLPANHWCMNPRSPKFGADAASGKGRSFRRLDWDKPSWTVAYGNREVHVHPNGKRRLSVYEAMLLQGFPTSYELRGTLSDQIRLVSDAVPPPLAQAIATSVERLLTRKSTCRA